MRTRLPARRLMAFALIAAAVFAACTADNSPVTSPSTRGSRATFDNQEGDGEVFVCKKGGPPGTYNFHIDIAGGGDWIWVYGPDLSIDFDGGEMTCKRAAYQTNEASWAPGATSTVTVNEILAPGEHVDSIQIYNSVTGGFEVPTLVNTPTAVKQVDFKGRPWFKYFNSFTSVPVCTDEAATNFGGPLPCVYPGKTFTIGPSSMEGHLKMNPGTWFNGGYSFKFIASHIATQFTVYSKVEIAVTCPYGGGPGGTITIPLGSKTYNVPANNTDWLPTGDQNSILSWMGAIQTPDLCGGFPMDNAKGAVFTATVSQNPSTGVFVDFRFKYRNPAAKGKTDTDCTNPLAPKRNDAATCGASWSQTVRDP